VDRCRIGFVGAGGVAARHARVLAGFPDVELVAVADPDAARAATLAGAHGARAYPGHGPMLDSAELDAVYICVPPFAHGEPEDAVVAAGLPFFVEKPLACEEATARRIARAVRARGLITAVGHHWRYLDTLARARELLTDYPVRLVTGHWLDKVPPVPWWTERVRSGGQVVEQAVHVLDLARAVVGEVVEVHAVAAPAPPPGPGREPGDLVDAATAATLRFADGAVGTLAATCRLGWKHQAALHVFADGLALELTETELAYHAGDGRTVETDPGRAKHEVDRAFVDAVRGRSDDIRVPYEEALRTHLLACAVARSVATGQPVAVPAAADPVSADAQPVDVEPADAQSVEVKPADALLAGGGRRGRPMTVRVLQVVAPGEPALVDEADQPVGDGRFRVDTLFSGVSAGTELTFVKGTSPHLSTAWDPVLGLFHADRPGTGYPVRRLGYMQVGRVTENGGTPFRPGQVVAMAYGHRTSHVADPAAEHVVPLPADVDPLLGIYAAHMGPICANGLLHAAADLYGPDVRGLHDAVAGRHVVVTGAGVVGLLTALFARRHGAADVTVADPTRERLAVARRLGLETLDTSAGPGTDPARTLKLRWRHGPGDHGADVVFQCRGRPESLALALRALRPQGTVVDLAYYQGGADAVRLGAEFHHNGLAIRCAQIGRVPRGLADRWDRARLSAATLDLLVAYGDDLRAHLVTDVVPFEDGPRLLCDLAERRRHALQAVLTVTGEER
jgi:predicted dehydrogenase/threonine dehydrogenase-like Zn-dependent dehydrogenase